MRNKVNIHPATFAGQVITGYVSQQQHAEAIAKDHLALYLNAYFLAEKFNTMENQLAEKAENKDFKALMAKVLETKLF
ncbi:hypothetical protein ACE3MZ_13345 [Paenibacillus sp. WLX1005]|uniref:hypothetical protein n=1 Tax=unclassified Paenibacillus TaxID=185978 RepID=UPI0039840D7B